jgi:arylsulfatase A-like enzyme
VSDRPDVIVIMTDEERAAPPYEAPDVLAWRDRTLVGRKWFDDHGVSFARHYTGSLACVPSRPTIFTGHYPDLHGVTQTDGIGKTADDSRMRWLRQGEVPTMGNWFRAAGYDTHYDGKWHISHADLVDPATGRSPATNDDDGVVDPAAVRRYLDADPLGPYGFSWWVGPEPHGALLANAGVRRDRLIADRVVAWLGDRYACRRADDPAALRPFLLVASFVNPHDIVLFPTWSRRSPVQPSPQDPPPVPPGCIRNGSTSTTRPPAFPSSSPALARGPRAPGSLPRPRRTSTCSRPCFLRPGPMPGARRHAGRRDGGRRRRAPVEAGPHLRRSGHLDRTRRASPGGQRARRRGLPHVAARRPVGAVRPDRRPGRSRQPLGRCWPA